MLLMVRLQGPEIADSLRVNPLSLVASMSSGLDELILWGSVRFILAIRMGEEVLSDSVLTPTVSESA
jgi:hypothetical protein